MAEHDSLAERGRALEEEYFRKKDKELVEKIRQAAAVTEARDAMERTTGLTDPALLQELLDLGFTPDTVSLLPLVPVVQMAWAEGGVTGAERDLLLKLARTRGIAEGTPADHLLAQWLTTRPADAVFQGAGRLIGAMLETGSAAAGDLTADDLVAYCEAIASASGGILGIGRISAEERQLLANIAADLRTRRT